MAAAAKCNHEERAFRTPLVTLLSSSCRCLWIWYVFTWIVLLLVSHATATDQHRPPPEFVADIYDNAPAVVKAALANVGLMRGHARRPYSQGSYSSHRGTSYEYGSRPQSSPAPRPPSHQSSQQYAVLPAPSSVSQPTNRPQYSRVLFPSPFRSESAAAIQFQDQRGASLHGESASPSVTHPRNFAIPSQLQRPPTEPLSSSVFAQESVLSPQYHRGVTSVPYHDPPTALHAPPVSSFQQPSYEYGGFVPITSSQKYASPNSKPSYASTPEAPMNPSSIVQAAAPPHEPPQSTFYLRQQPEGKSLASEFQRPYSVEDNSISSSSSSAMFFDEEQRYEASKMLDSVTINCAGSKDLGWCDYNDDYPSPFINGLLKRCSDVVDRMYVEVPDNLLDDGHGRNFYAEPSSSMNFTLKIARERSSHTSWSWSGNKAHYESLCEADRHLLRPGFARDINGEWFLIVQSNRYHQRIPSEVCRSPGGQCRNLAECGVNAHCIQRYTHRLLMSVDLSKEDACPLMRLFRFPSSCNCDVSTAAGSLAA